MGIRKYNPTTPGRRGATVSSSGRLVNRTVYDTVCEDQQVTCYRTLRETAYREQQYTVCRPVPVMIETTLKLA